MSDPKTVDLTGLNAAEVGMLRELLQKANVPVMHARTAANLMDKVKAAHEAVKGVPASA